MIGQTGVVSHHLRSLLVPLSYLFCVHLYAKYDVLMLKLRRLYYTTLRRFELLASLEECNQLFTWTKIMKQLAFLIICSTPSLKNSAQISTHSFWLIQLIFTVFHVSTLGPWLQSVGLGLGQA